MTTQRDLILKHLPPPLTSLVLGYAPGIAYKVASENKAFGLVCDHCSAYKIPRSPADNVALSKIDTTPVATEFYSVSSFVKVVKFKKVEKTVVLYIVTLWYPPPLR